MSTEKHMKEAVVLYTLPFSGHLIPIVNLAKTFVNHGFSAIVMTFNYSHPDVPAGNANKEVSHLSLANPTIAFHVLPLVSLGDGYTNLKPPAFTRALLGAQKTNFQNFIQDLSDTVSVRAIVLGLLCTFAPDVAGIPVYILTVGGASSAALFLHLFELDASTNLSLKDFAENPTNFVGLPPVPVSDFPSNLLDRKSDAYKSLMQNLSVVLKSDGILINTFESLEPKAISVLREGICVPSFKMPPVYCIGPLMTETREEQTDDRHECLKWLDSQPKGAVVFLCFGSMGSFPLEQIRQIAIGLENSSQRFLWVVKAVTDHLGKILELDQMLPEGFLDRTKNRGMVVKTWAPQVQVLHHESVGGFVTHCGWNSIIEAVTSGKPMLCWPLYAEQRLNKAVLEEMKLGVVIEGYDKEMVEAGEVEAKVRWLIESEGSNLLKEHTKVMKDKAAESWTEIGSSWTEIGSSSKAFMQLLMDSGRRK